MSLMADPRRAAASAEVAPDESSARPPLALLISIAGAMAVLVLAAAWLWMTRGAAILLDIGQVFCF